MVTVRFDTPPKFVIVALFAYRVFRLELPDTVSAVNVPSVVMFGWFAVVIDPLIVPALMFSDTFKFSRFPCAALKVPAVTVPDAVILFA